VIPARVFATAQVPDKLIYKGDTLSIFANPLEQLYGNDSIRPKYFGEKEVGFNTGCWRGYIAEWTIMDNTLYLTGIYSCDYHKDRIKADLPKLFGDKCINGKVEANWVTEKIISPQGKLLYYINDGYASIYEMELEFNFLKGKLAGTKLYDNSKTRQSAYSQDSRKLEEYIYKNIHWPMIPDLDDKIIKLFVQFSANENGVVDSAKIIRGNENGLYDEALRVVKNIPDWDVLYRHGEFQRETYTIPIIFSEKNRKKYSE
jgi:hypothetical protein